MRIDLRSDTVTRPTSAMRKAMADAEVGDDDRDRDPTMRKLEDRVADVLGKDAALFCVSGTMANQIALWLLGRRGTEVLIDANAHIVHLEMAGAAAFAGLQIRPVSSEIGIMHAESLEAAIRPPSPDAPRASLVCLENTHNHAGGKVIPLPSLRAMQDVAKKHDLAVHLDGARLWNATVATGTRASDFADCADTVMVSFSKGLGAPIGAALAGPEDVMAEARLVRKRFGGSLRQSGILAAAALHGLNEHWLRMAEDHERARELAFAVDGVREARVVSPDTNIVMIELPEGMLASTVVAKAAENEVLVLAWTPTRIRAVLHLDIDKEEARTAAEVLARAILKS